MLYFGDCIQGMRDNIPDNSIDLVFTDPPYGIEGDKLDAHYNRDESFVVPGYIDVPKKDYALFSEQWIGEAERCLRPGGSLYIVSGYTNLIDVLNALHQTSLIEVNHLVAEYTFGVNTSKKWVSSHYHVLYWVKPPKAKVTFRSNCRFTDSKDSYHDRVSVQMLSRDYKPGQVKNKNQLSEDFITKFVQYSSEPGDSVLDPFLGGFTTARVAKRMGRVPYGFEANINAYDAFLPTVAAVVPEPEPEPLGVDDPVEMAKREKLREGWKRKRQEQKREVREDDEMFVFGNEKTR
jgi:site-specific DNA-methyltransferase (adenine-specific)